MKKKFMKLAGMLVILCMLFATVGCSTDDRDDDDDKEKTKTEKEAEEVTIVGKWEAEIDFTEVMKSQMTEEDEEMMEYFDFEDLTLVMVVEFDDEGNCTTSFDKDSVEEFAENLKEQLSDGMKAYMEEALSEMGYTVDSYLAEMDMTWDEFMAESMDVDALVEEMVEEQEMIYELDGDKLYMTDGDEIDEDNYTVIELEADKMTWTEIVGDDEDDMGSLLPLEFKKK